MRQRIEWLKGDRGHQGTPDMCGLMSDTGDRHLPLSSETIERDGLARILLGTCRVVWRRQQRSADFGGMVAEYSPRVDETRYQVEGRSLLKVVQIIQSPQRAPP